MKVMKTLIALLALVVVMASAIYRGTVDVNEELPAVGMMFGARNISLYPTISCNVTELPALFAGCSVSLIDVDDFLSGSDFSSLDKTTLRRRLVSSPSHCATLYRADGLPPFDHPNATSVVGFKYDIYNSPGKLKYGQLTNTLGHPACTGPIGNSSTVGFDTVNYRFYSYKILSIAEFVSDGMGIGKYKNDFAFFILDQAVPANIVPDNKLIKIVKTSYAALSANVIPRVGTAGFGILTYGTDMGRDNILGKPEAILGPRLRAYAELDIASVQNSNINAKMVLATGVATLCSGDSGSPALRLPISAGFYSYGHTTAGDAQCRATNTFTRTGTPHYMDWALRALRAYLDGGLEASQYVLAGSINDFLSAGATTAAIEGDSAPVAATTVVVDTSNAVFHIYMVGIVLAVLLVVVIVLVVRKSYGRKRM